jgi:hypothetical protein
VRGVTWKNQSKFTDPGAAGAVIDELPADLAALREASSQLVFHYRADGDWAENGVPAERAAEIDTRYADAMFELLLSRGEPTLARKRLPPDRVVGCCRDSTLLFVSLARRKGIPARMRVGFAAYLEPGLLIDHVVGSGPAPAGGTGPVPARGPADRQALMLRTLLVEAEVQFAPGQSVTVAWTTATPSRNGAPFTSAAARPDSRCGLPVHVNPDENPAWATRTPTACVVVGLTLPSSPATQVTVMTTWIAAPLATSVAELTLIASMLVADARAAVAAAAGEAGEAGEASAAAGTSAAAQAMPATTSKCLREREWSCMVSLLW